MVDKPKITNAVTQAHRFSKPQGHPEEYVGVGFDFERTEKTTRGETESLLLVMRYVDGAISFSDKSGEAFVYVYPDQVRELRRVINLPKPRKPTKRQRVGEF